MAFDTVRHPRPGSMLGAYPQRADLRLGGLDRAMAVAFGLGRRAVDRVPLGRRRFVARVRAEEAALAALDGPAFAAALADLRRDLRLSGLRDPHVARAFAAVRLCAGRVLDMRHFDVQLIGGRVLLDGRIAEMDTGEGKTLTATLAAATAAMAGIPTHVVTVNDFLAARDAGTMSPLYAALGLRTGLVQQDDDPDRRRAAYACDICYVTNKQLAFDYLKDGLILAREQRPLHLRIEGLHAATPRLDRVMMRGLCYAIVDEADSCLVDEARTPLVISRAGDMSDMEETFQRAIAVARQLITPRDFVVGQRERKIVLTDLGEAQVRRLSKSWGGVWAAEVHRHELAQQALSALHLYERDKHYIVRDGTIQIVDEYTGRIMGDRKWERGLHQMIEVKEGLEVTGRNETLARISYQRFFRRYLRLSGMTGTARELSGEFWSVYRLLVTRVPRNLPSRRRRHPRRYFAREEMKWRAVAERVAVLHAQGQPVLIGTRSVAASEILSGLLTARGLPHRVLNARQDQSEADIVAGAGEAGQITVATNMAGRGTDIRLSADARRQGGLVVIGTELHDSARIDRQLFGRCGRQGDPGGYQMFVSFEDELIRDIWGVRLDPVVRLLARASGRVTGALGRPAFWIAQAATEQSNSSLRRSLLRYDDNLDDLLAFSGTSE